jgi:hypothetical protein
MGTVEHANANPDPRSAYGELYLISPPAPDGKMQMLSPKSGVTPGGDNVPAQAVVNNRVVIAAEGISETPQAYTAGWTQTFQVDTPGFVNVGQPIVGVHEGTGQKTVQDVERIAGDFLALKKVEAGYKPITSLIYYADPAVKTLHDVVEQQLDRNRDVLLLAHSGGGAESALALNILAHESGGKYGPEIAQHVRVVDFAGAAAAQDYADAGVPLKNVFFSADKRDAVGQFGSVYVDPQHPGSALLQDMNTLKGALNDTQDLGKNHGPWNIMTDNYIGGHQAVGDFIAGGPGGTYMR